MSIMDSPIKNNFLIKQKIKKSVFLKNTINSYIFY